MTNSRGTPPRTKYLPPRSSEARYTPFRKPRFQRSSVVERSAVNRLVVGSSPTAGAISRASPKRSALENAAGCGLASRLDENRRDAPARSSLFWSGQSALANRSPSSNRSSPRSNNDRSPGCRRSLAAAGTHSPEIRLTTLRRAHVDRFHVGRKWIAARQARPPNVT